MYWVLLLPRYLQVMIFKINEGEEISPTFAQQGSIWKQNLLVEVQTDRMLLHYHTKLRQESINIKIFAFSYLTFNPCGFLQGVLLTGDTLWLARAYYHTCAVRPCCMILDQASYTAVFKGA